MSKEVIIEKTGLPAGWEIKTLGEIAEVKSGGTPSRARKEFWVGSIPWYSSGELNNIYTTSSERHINQLAIDNSTAKLFKKGSLLIGMYDTAALKMSILDRAGTFNQAISGVAPNKNIDLQFILHSINSIKPEILNQRRGVRQKNLNLTKIKNIPIFLPPIKQQKQIVTTLDKAFAAIDTAKANAEQNLQNAKELFESYLQNVFENSSWSKTTLSQITDDISDGDHMPPPKTETGIPFITIRNINKNTYSIDFSNTFYVSVDYFEKIKSKRKPKKGDVLYTVTGSYGVPVLITSNFEFCFQRHIGLIRPKKDINSKWLFYWILSPQALKQANEKATGTAQKTVSLKTLRNFIIPIVPLEEQKQIVKKMDALSTQTKKLEAIYTQKLKDLEELKKSILQKAFSGQLI